MRSKVLSKRIIRTVPFVLIIGLISCSPFASQEVEIIDIDGDGLISFSQEIGSLPTPGPSERFVQKVSIIQNPLTENHLQCSPNYSGTQGNDVWISVTHPSLSAIHILRPDNKGNMWVGTAGKGVAVFDGERWEHWSMNSNSLLPYDAVPGIGAANIAAIAAIDYEPVIRGNPTSGLNHKGAILVLDEQENDWKDIEAPFEVGKNINNLPGLAVNERGDIFVPFTTSEVFQQNESSGSDEKNTGIVDSILSLFSSNHEREPIYKGKLGIFSNGEWKIVDMPTPPPLGINDAQIDSSGNYWLATSGAGVWMYNGQEWRTYTAGQKELLGNMVIGIAQTKEGYIWAGTPIGIALLQVNGTTVVLNREDYPFGSTALEGITVDNENRLWLLSHDQISIYNGREWSLLRTPGAGSPTNWSYNIALDKDGCIWVAKSGSMLVDIFRNQIDMEAGDYRDLISTSPNAGLD